MEYDLTGLGSYLSEFSLLGSVPTSLSGYGFGQVRHVQELSALGASAASDSDIGPKPAASKLKLGTQRQLDLTAYLIRDVQRDLDAIKAKPSSTGRWDKATQAAWTMYTKVFRVANTEAVPASGGSFSQDFVWLNRGSRTTLASKAAAARKSDPAPAAAKPAAKPAAVKPAAKSTAKPAAGSVLVEVGEMQRILVALGQPRKGIDDGKFGPTTKAKWAASANKFKLNPAATGNAGATAASVNAGTYARLSAEASKALSPEPVPAPTPDVAPAQPATPAVTTATAKTADVQKILRALGHKAKALSDGKFGPATKAAWEASAKKYDVSPIIAGKAGATSVTVDQATFDRLRTEAVASAAKPGDVVADTVDIQNLLKKLGWSGSKLDDGVYGPYTASSWTSSAKKRGVDPFIAKAAPDGRKVTVREAALAALIAEVQKQAPAPAPLPPPGPERSELDRAVDAIVNAATSSVNMDTVRYALNGAVQAGVLKVKPFKVSPWVDAHRDPLLDYLGITTEPGRAQWAAALVKGKLVSSDGHSVKLPPKQVDGMKKAAERFANAEKTAIPAGFVEADAQTVINAVNQLNVSDKMFDYRGGPQELSDALATFFENTKTPLPAGDLVWVSPNKVAYVRTAVLTALSKASKAAEARSDASKVYRDSIVSNALQQASGYVSVADLQQAIAESVAAGKAGKLKDLYSKVKLTGAFDEPTRAAYTEVARTLTIGPAILELEKLLKAQLGPNYKAALVEEARNQTWKEFLHKAVATKDGKLSVATIPAIATTVTTAAKAYRGRESDAAVAAKFATEEKKALDDTIARSNVLVPVLNVQQAAMQLVEGAKAGASLTPQEKAWLSGVRLTGVADKPTKEALKFFSGWIFPKGYSISETAWSKYLSKVGLAVSSGSAKLAEFGMILEAAGPVSLGWSSATNYIGLPKEAADYVAELATLWAGDHGTSAAPPVPLTDDVVLRNFKRPSVVTVTVPQKPAVQEREINVTDQEARQAPPPESAPAAQPAAQPAAMQPAGPITVPVSLTLTQQVQQPATPGAPMVISPGPAAPEQLPPPAPAAQPESPLPAYEPPSDPAVPVIHAAYDPSGALPAAPDGGGNSGLLIAGALAVLAALALLGKDDKKKDAVYPTRAAGGKHERARRTNRRP